MGFIISDLTSALVSVGARRAEYKENLDLFKARKIQLFVLAKSVEGWLCRPLLLVFRQRKAEVPKRPQLPSVGDAFSQSIKDLKLL